MATKQPKSTSVRDRAKRVSEPASALPANSTPELALAALQMLQITRIEWGKNLGLTLTPEQNRFVGTIALLIFVNAQAGQPTLKTDILHELHTTHDRTGTRYLNLLADAGLIETAPAPDRRHRVVVPTPIFIKLMSDAISGHWTGRRDPPTSVSVLMYKFPHQRLLSKLAIPRARNIEAISRHRTMAETVIELSHVTLIYQPDNVVALLNIAAAYLVLGKFDEALSLLKKVESHAPGRSDTRMVRAVYEKWKERGLPWEA